MADDGKMSAGGASVRATVAALVASVALALAYGRVAMANLTTGLVGGNSNGYENVWNDWWLRESLRHLHNPFFTNALFYPTGVSLRFHTLNPFGGLLAVPLVPLLGEAGAMNAKFLAALAGAIFCAWLLLYDATGSGLAAFGGAALYALASDQAVYYFNTGAENYLMGTALLPLFLFFALRAAERTRPYGWSAAALLTLLLLCLTDWQYTMFAVIVTLVYVAVTWATRRPWREKARVTLRLAVVGVGWLAIVALPLVLPMLREARQSPWLAVSGQATSLSRALAQFVLPGMGNPGYLALIVATVGLALFVRRGADERERRAVIFWGVVAAVGAVLSLGPYLKLTPGREATSVPLPYAVLYRLPVLSVGRRPQLFYFIALLGFAVLFAFGLREVLRTVGRLLARRPTPERWRAVPPVVVALLVAGIVAPFAQATGEARAFPLTVPPFYRDVLAKDTDDYAILELPLFAIEGRGTNWPALQTVHRKEVFDGSISRDHKLESPNIFVKRATLYRDLYWIGRPDVREQFRPTRTPDFLAAPPYDTVGLPLLNYYHVRYIILYPDALNALTADGANVARGIVRHALGANNQPLYTDATMEVFRVPDAPALAQPLVLDTGSVGWYPADKSTNGLPYRWADTSDGSAAELLVWNLSGERKRGTVQMTVYNYKSPRTVEIAINGYAADNFALAPDQAREVSLVLDFPPGLNVLTLASPEPPIPVQIAPGGSRDDRLLSFGTTQVRLVP